ncbi:hypothetical protein BGZ76_002861 [Entomortierella beljakovae]|nr:hypothetical protein BGZ76_002861 [Entomortierella beljakovae]
MESQSHPVNPWSFQQLEQGYESEEEGEHTQSFSKNIHFRRNSIDRRHYSYASSTTLAPDTFDDDKDLNYDDGPEDSTSLQYFTSPQKQSPDLDLDVQSTAIATTTITTSESHISSTSPEEEFPNLSTNNSNNSNISDSGVGFEGDVVEYLVQKLQSEVADTRAIVFDLSSRLNAAENSNQHIVDELKMLLADAEGTLVGSDESDSGESVEEASSKHGSSSISDEDSNVVYNRICNALQSLISEAQSALARSSSAGSTSNAGALLESSHMDRRLCRHQLLLRHQPQNQRQLLSSELSLEEGDGDTSSQLDGNCGHSSCRTSRRSSLSITRSEKSYFYNVDGPNIQEDWEYLRSQGASSSASSSPSSSSPSSSSSLPSTHIPESVVSTSATTTTTTTTTDTTVTGSPTAALLPSLELPPTNENELPSQQITTPSAPSARSDALVGKGKRVNSKVEQLHRIYQTQLLSPQVRAPQLSRKKTDYALAAAAAAAGVGAINSYQQPYSSSHSIMSTTPTHRGRPRQPLPTQRQFRSQGVGSSTPPQSVLVQLYELWKQTWLRRRIMHVLTGSLEIMLILWVIYKLSDRALAWMGIHSLKAGPQLWLKYIYGEREGEGSSAAKELYLRIRKHGLRSRNIQSRREKESREILKEFVPSEANMLVMGTSTPFTPSGIVWVPLSRMLGHAVSGILLAYLVDRVRYIAKRL